VTLGQRYLTGVAAVSAAGALLSAMVPGGVRGSVVWGILTGLVLQVPLGWLALRSIGTDHFMASWVAGMLVRLAAVGVAGLVVAPQAPDAAGPMLGSMVGVLVALLLIEGYTAAREHSREGER
jgi:ABC-type transporter Mla maintaining outer membrane lipid asymmetry permease subunit MlaE